MICEIPDRVISGEGLFSLSLSCYYLLNLLNRIFTVIHRNKPTLDRYSLFLEIPKGSTLGVLRLILEVLCTSRKLQLQYSCNFLEVQSTSRIKGSTPFVAMGKFWL